MDVYENLDSYQIILASKSPRRHKLLKELGVDFKIKTGNIEENFPSDLPVREIPPFLAKLKAGPFKNELKKNDLLITSDTVVVLKEKVINKPNDKEDAIKMLQQLSGNVHEVVTAVYLLSIKKEILFSVSTRVYFRELQQKEIEFYVEKYNPLDKAGAYGIQEWIGYIGIEKIEGSFYNVMGLPVKEVHEALKKF